MKWASQVHELKVWQAARAMTGAVYQITNKGGFKSDYSLKDQIRRSAVSVPSNVAEGFGRGSKKDFLRFLYIARGSLEELRTQLIISVDISFVSEAECDPVHDKCNETGRLLGGLIRRLEAQLELSVEEPQSNYRASNSNVEFDFDLIDRLLF